MLIARTILRHFYQRRMVAASAVQRAGARLFLAA
jgi:hypothetical protein